MAKAMISPVACNHCGKTYDLAAAVTVTARFSDCSCFTTPCCGRNVDDREFVSSPAFHHVYNGSDQHSRFDRMLGITRDGVRFRRAEEHKSEF
jgi:hypothetical protein